ncbi:hypothetical protein SmJEL517_g05614 [Synchytrium microbalum]|uniref:Methyltransferase domain-containing protein n=1 Tax=Synchytrium microbalum TaxID=1806994 RepID=A0A507C001_9FUNG|nr:uncharacterized protein SmJEL517_g05614 [Synchytrium microbalum]TPX30925.1 hypothetical protein SmJEL517_g05614 [Synchytrium microbalum]
MSTVSKNDWDSKVYQTNAGFVPLLTSDLLTLAKIQPGESIFDLGCGDGILTVKLITDYKASKVLGVDSAASMIEKAQQLSNSQSLKNIEWGVHDCQDLEASGYVAEGQKFDVVFSNAAIHWMKSNPAGPPRGAFALLKPGGRFVAELGGFTNVASIHSALIAAVKRRGQDGESLSPWYYPSVGAYAKLLKDAGFEVETIGLFPRPTDLPTNVRGWLNTFVASGSFMTPFSPQEREEILNEVVDQLKPVLCDETGHWIADYVRLRFSARKPL